MKFGREYKSYFSTVLLGLYLFVALFLRISTNTDVVGNLLTFNIRLYIGAERKVLVVASLEEDALGEDSLFDTLGEDSLVEAFGD